MRSNYFEAIANPDFGKETLCGDIDKTDFVYLPIPGKEFEAKVIALGLTEDEQAFIRSNEPKNIVASAPYNIYRGSK